MWIDASIWHPCLISSNDLSTWISVASWYCQWKKSKHKDITRCIFCLYKYIKYYICISLSFYLCKKMLDEKQNGHNNSYKGCLDSRKWAEVRKWGSVIFHFRCTSKHRKRKMRKPFFLFSFSFHNYFLTSRVLQLILWSCKSDL